MTAPPPAPAAPGGRRPHILAFDLFRLLIVGFVVGVHTLAVGGGTITVALGAFVTVFHTSRELFFLLTAFVLTYNYGRRPLRRLKFWRRRLSLVIPGYVTWSLIYFLADGQRLDPVTAALAAFGRELLTGSARYQLYFLLVTMQVYLAFPLLRWLLHKTAGHHLALLLAAATWQAALTVAAQQHLVTSGLAGEWLRHPDALAPSYLFYLVAGAAAGWHYERLAAFTRRHPAAAGLTALAGTAAGAGTYLAQVFLGGQTPAAASAVFQPVVIAEAAALGWGLFALGLRWAGAGARYRCLVSAGADCSFGIYLAHPLILQGLLAAAAATGVLATVRSAPAPAELAVLLGVVLPLVYGASWALVSVIRRTPASLPLTGRRRSPRPVIPLTRKEHSCVTAATPAMSPSPHTTSTPLSPATSAAWASNSPGATPTG